MTLRKIFLVATCIALPIMAAAQGRTVKDEMLHMQQTRKVSFVYDSSLKTDIPYKGAALDGMSLGKALRTLFKGTGISYKVRGGYVMLKADGKGTPKIVKPAASGQKAVKKPVKAAATAGKHTISGYVRDSHGETLINATVYDLTTRQGTMTNSYGFFSLTLPDGGHELRVSYLGFKDRRISLTLDADQHRDVSLTENATLGEVVVTADLNSPLINTQTGKRSFSRDDIKSEFSLLSSPDVVKTLQRVSGVAEGVELASGLYVHGGGNDENLYLIDGSPLYSVNHTLGLFSAFNADVVKNVDFYKSGFPARYGGRLSSVVDVRTADGDFQHYHGSYRIGLIDGGVQVEGPIRRGRTSFNFGLRRSWMDIITRPFFAIYNRVNSDEDDDITLNYFFHDINAKVTNIFSDRSRLSLSMYSGNDGLTTKDDYTYTYNVNDDTGDYSSSDKDNTKNRFTWGNLNVALDWQYQFAPKLFANFSGVYTWNRSKLYSAETAATYYKGKGEQSAHVDHTYRSTISDLGYRAAFDYRPSPHHHLRFGTDYTWHNFHPQTRRDNTSNSNNGQRDSTRFASTNNITAHEWNAYAEDEITVNDRWSFNAGLNASLFHVQGKDFAYADPRLAAKFQAAPWLSFKASWTTMTQYVHKISNSVLDLPSDYWVPTTYRLKPMRSRQVAAGAYLQPNNHWLLSVEGYYKQSRHLLQYSSWTGLEPPAENWDRLVMDGRGRSYGLEFDATYKAHNLLLQGSYTLSWSKRKFDDFFPQWYYDKFDNRHKINLSARWNISDKVSAYAAWSFHSGNRITVPSQYVKMPVVPGGQPIVRRDMMAPMLTNNDMSEWLNLNADGEGYSEFVYERPNGFPLPAYHRLDIGLDFRHKTKHGHERVWNLSLYNAYCHLNSLWVDYDFDRQGRFIVKNHAYIPIIPSCSYTIKF